MRVFLFAVALLTSCASAKATYTEVILRCTSTTMCTITKNLGGVPYLFKKTAEEVLGNNTKVVIDGPCYSACVIFASYARKNVCLTKHAKMLIHYGNQRHVYDAQGQELGPYDDLMLQFAMPSALTVKYTYFMPDYGADINEWALKYQKVPSDPKKFYSLKKRELRKFWRRCAAHQRTRPQ